MKLVADTVRESSGRVLVHCLAGISRSPTIVIAYVMHHLRLSIDDAYRYESTADEGRRCCGPGGEEALAPNWIVLPT